jgi:HEAT repeat protein
LKDRQIGVRLAAVRSLGRIGANAKETVHDIFLSATPKEDTEGVMTTAVAAALMDIGSPIEFLCTKLRDPDRDIRMTAANVLRAMGHNAWTVQAKVALESVLKDHDPDVRFAAASALAVIGPAPKEAVSILIAGLQDKDQVWTAIGLLGAVQPPARDAIPALIRLLGEDDPQVAEAAKSALTRMDLPRQRRTAQRTHREDDDDGDDFWSDLAACGRTSSASQERCLSDRGWPFWPEYWPEFEPKDPHRRR